MSTQYDQRPTLEESIRASRLVVVGTVESVELLAQARVGQVDEQQAIAHVDVADVLHGAIERRRISVRFIVSGGRTAAARSHPLKKGQQVILILVPDVGRDVRPNTWIAYFGGHYPLLQDSSFVVPVGSVEAGEKSRRVSLKKFRAIIRGVNTEQAAEVRLWEKYESRVLAERLVTRITELPEPEHGLGPAQARPLEPSEARAPRRVRRRKK
jgi:hypothetical protein